MNKRNIFEFVSILVTCILLLSTIYFLTFTLKQQDDLRAKMEMERVLFDIYAQSKVEAIDIVSIFLCSNSIFTAYLAVSSVDSIMLLLRPFDIYSI